MGILTPKRQNLTLLFCLFSPIFTPKAVAITNLGQNFKVVRLPQNQNFVIQSTPSDLKETKNVKKGQKVVIFGSCLLANKTLICCN